MEIQNKDQLILSWRNVTAWIRQTYKTSEKKKLLDNVSGIAKSGFLTAIVSPSGAGKTTLLAILSKRYKGFAEGKILLNGHDLTPEQMSCISGYAGQKDQNYDYLSVNEHLTFVARLKMNCSVPADVRRKTVFRVVNNLLLSQRMNVKIGSLSGGQRKRLTLAAQLLTEPKILFCDEPTTGLDSYNAERVVQLLRTLANKGKMIICTIHQPASGIFETFDDVTVLVPGGRLGYSGPVSEINSHFSRLGFKCPENYNLCEYIVSLVTVKNELCKENEFDEYRVRYMVASYRNSKMHELLELELDAITKNKTDSSTLSGTINCHRVCVSCFEEFYLLLCRTLLILKNSYKTELLNFFSYMFVFCAISWLYGRIKMNQEGVQNMIGMLNMIMLQILFSSSYGVVNIFPEEMPIIVQESADRLYSPFSFYSSKIIVLTLKAVFESFIFISYAYSVTGLSRTLSDYFTSAVPSTILSITSVAYGFFLSTAFTSVNTYSLFSVPFEILSMAFAGVTLRLNSLPPFLSWIRFISIPYFAYEAMSILQWVKHSHIVCNKSFELCYLNGDEVLQSLGFSRDHLKMDYLGLFVYFFILHILAFIFLKRRLKTSLAY